MKTTEHDLQEGCARILELDGWRRLRTDPVSRREWGKGFGEKGMADDLFIRYLGVTAESTKRDQYVAEVLWVEWKRKGGKAAAHQHAWHTLERKRGSPTLIAGEDFGCTVEDFKAWYKATGLNRNVL